MFSEEFEARAQTRFEHDMKNPNLFGQWYPSVLRLAEEGKVKIPKTVQLPLPRQVSDLVLKESPQLFIESKEVQELVARVREQFHHMDSAALFMKTSLFSAKHDWKKTCYLTPSSDIAMQLFAMLYTWWCVGGQYANELIIREMIPTVPLFHAFHGEIPITQEYRLFSNASGAYAYQPYWPAEAIRRASVSDDEVRTRLEAIKHPGDALLDRMKEQAAQITSLLQGDYSVDFLIDHRGEPWLIDMALSSQSYHSSEKVCLLDEAAPSVSASTNTFEH